VEKPLLGPGVHVERPHNESATWSVLAGVIGILCGLVGFLFWIMAFAAGITAIVLGANAIRHANAHPAMGRRWVAAIGIVAGIGAIAMGAYTLALAI
jgi:hypothetical protein